MHAPTRVAALTAAAVAAVLVWPATAVLARPVSDHHSTAPTAVTAPASLVYVKNGDIYLAHPNGSHAKLVKAGTYYWPSMSDKGVIAAEGYDKRTAPDGSRGVSIYRFTQRGRLLGHEPTPQDFSTFSCPRYAPNSVALSPDGTKLAYDYFLCDEQTSVWTPSTKLAFPHQGAGQEEYHDPTWLSNSQIMLTHVGVRVAGGKEVGVYNTAHGQNTTSNWFNADPFATGFSATATRTGTKIAVIEDDAANYYDGRPRHVKLMLGKAAGIGQPVTFTCRISLPTRPFKSSTALSNPRFSPNGAALVWNSDHAIWRANTLHIAPSACSTVKPHAWRLGAFDGFFSPATDTR